MRFYLLQLYAIYDFMMFTTVSYLRCGNDFIMCTNWTCLRLYNAYDSEILTTLYVHDFIPFATFLYYSRPDTIYDFVLFATLYYLRIYNIHDFTIFTTLWYARLDDINTFISVSPLWHIRLHAAYDSTMLTILNYIRLYVFCEFVIFTML